MSTTKAVPFKGSVFQIEDPGTPETFVGIGELVDVSKSGGGRAEIDVTDAASSAKEFLMGFKDQGGFALSVNFSLDDAGQTHLRTAEGADAPSNFKLILPTGTLTTGSFSAYVQNIDFQGANEGAYRGSVNLRITGDVIWS